MWHLPGAIHYKELGAKYILDGTPVDEVRHRLWQQCLVPGGAVRINLLDGEVQICKSTPPAMQVAVATALAAQAAVSAASAHEKRR